MTPQHLNPNVAVSLWILGGVVVCTCLVVYNAVRGWITRRQVK